MRFRSGKALCIRRFTDSRIEVGSNPNGKITESGREAKFYSVAKIGRQQLKAETDEWKRLCEAISLVLETAE